MLEIAENYDKDGKTTFFVAEMFVKGKNCGIVGTAGFIDLPADHKNTKIQVKSKMESKLE